jgi:hypothetical protein
MTYGTLISTQTVGTAVANIDFNSIPSTYNDLLIVVSGRFSDATGGNWSDGNIQFNSAGTASFSGKLAYGQGTGSAVSINDWIIRASSSTNTANTFGSMQIYIPDYAGSTNKQYSVDYVSENNATGAIQGIVAGLWSNTAAITSIRLASVYSTWAVGTTVSLYGVKNYASTYVGTKGTGGTVYISGGYTYHVFPYSDTFTCTTSTTADILVVAGGGGGGSSIGGGGGGGGYQVLTSQSLTSGSKYHVQVGAGGATDTIGNNSVFGALTASVGGGRGGGPYTSNNAGIGGSGGGSSAYSSGGSGGAGTAGQGNSGGGGANNGSNYWAGGGGGAGATGGAGAYNSGTLTAGNGGAGSNSVASWATATGTGASGYYAGGGGGSGFTATTMAGGLGGSGGGGQGNLTNGTPTVSGTSGIANTGGGGGGGSYGVSGNSGGSGLVIVRYAS